MRFYQLQQTPKKTRWRERLAWPHCRKVTGGGGRSRGIKTALNGFGGGHWTKAATIANIYNIAIMFNLQRQRLSGYKAAQDKPDITHPHQPNP